MGLLGNVGVGQEVSLEGSFDLVGVGKPVESFVFGQWDVEERLGFAHLMNVSPSKVFRLETLPFSLTSILACCVLRALRRVWGVRIVRESHLSELGEFLVEFRSPRSVVVVVKLCPQSCWILLIGALMP